MKLSHIAASTDTLIMMRSYPKKSIIRMTAEGGMSEWLLGVMADEFSKD